MSKEIMNLLRQKLTPSELRQVRSYIRSVRAEAHGDRAGQPARSGRAENLKKARQALADKRQHKLEVKERKRQTLAENKRRRREQIEEIKENGRLFNSRRDRNSRGIVYYLNTFNIHKVKTYEQTIFKDIQKAYTDVRTTYPDFRPHSKAVLNIVVEIIKTEPDDELREDEVKDKGDEKKFVTLRFQELAYPDIDFGAVRRDIGREIARYTASDLYLEVHQVRLLFLPAPIGGCFTQEGFKHDFKKLNLNGVVLKNPKSTNNNCFFYALKPEFNEAGIKLTESVIRNMRQEFGLKDKAMVDIATGGEIAKKYLNKRVGFCNESVQYFGQQGDVNLMIWHPSTSRASAPHYLRFECEQRVCEYCGKLYNNKHDPTVCIHRRLLREVKASGEKYVFPAKMKTEKSKDLHLSVFHYDIETHKANEYGQSVPDCVGYVWRDEKTQELVYEYQTGEDCMVQMLNKLKTLSHIQFINAFNGSRFDHLYLIQYAQKFQSLSDIAPVKAPSGIINAKIFGKSCIDLSRHLQGSLKKCLQSVGCAVQKGEFDHNLNTGWDNLTPKLQSEMLEYLKGDVMGLAELSEKFHFACMENYGCSWINFISTSQMTYAVWTSRIEKDFLSDGKILLPSEQQWAFIQKAIYGGRTQVHRKQFTSESYYESIRLIESGRMTSEFFDSIKDYLVDADVVSLYPTAMLEAFPIGVPYQVDGWREGLLGIYEVDYTPAKNILTPVLPCHRDGRTVWDLQAGKGVYTSVDLETARSFGYTFTVKVGLVWPEKGYVFKDYIEEMFKRKETSVKDSPAYTLAKLFMNGLYGKTIQRPRWDRTLFVKEGKDWNKILPNYYITEIDCENFDDVWIVNGEVKDPVIRGKAISKPTQLGAFVLAYSRRIMLDKIKTMNPREELSRQFYYTDTDSLQVHNDVLRGTRPDASVAVNGKKLGELSNDLLKGNMLDVKIIRGVWVAPKMYILQYLAKMKDGTVQLLDHRVGKGVKKVDGKIPFDLKNYERMGAGGTLKVVNKDVFKRFMYSLNNVEKSKKTSFFSVAIRDAEKELNKYPWEGRRFIGNDSVPFGYEDAVRNLT